MTTLTAPQSNSILESIRRFLESIAVTDKWALLEPAVAKMERDFKLIWSHQKTLFLREMVRYRGQFTESLSEDQIDRIMNKVSIITATEMETAIRTGRMSAMTTAAEHFISVNKFDISFSLANPKAVEYLAQSGATRVVIDRTTQGYIRTIVTEGAEKGWSYNKTASEISKRFDGFSVKLPQKHLRNRAELVVVNETGNAYEVATSSVVDDMERKGLLMEKSWMTSGDDRVSSGCAKNEAAGWLLNAEAFPSEHMHPLRFPGCRCTTLYRRRPD